MPIPDVRILAEIGNERYVWHPDIHTQQEIARVQRELENLSADLRTTAYCLEGPGHLTDFQHWREALTNRRMTFRRTGFMFCDENIAALLPIGYIMLVRDEYCQGAEKR